MAVLEPVRLVRATSHASIHRPRGSRGRAGGGRSEPDAGSPCVRDTRVTVSAVLGQLAAGASIDDLLADYPYPEREDVLAALEYAAAAAQERGLAVVAPAA